MAELVEIDGQRYVKLADNETLARECADSRHREVDVTRVYFAGPWIPEEGIPENPLFPSVAIVEGQVYTARDGYAWRSVDGSLELYIEDWHGDWELLYAEICPTDGHRCETQRHVIRVTEDE